MIWSPPDFGTIWHPFDFITNHPYKSVLYAWFFCNIVTTMPTPIPNGVGLRGTVVYEWAFALLHSFTNLTRLLITFFPQFAGALGLRSEEHTSELQSRQYLVCR